MKESKKFLWKASPVLVCLIALQSLVALESCAQVQEAWVARYDGPANDRDQANAIAIDGNGNVYVTGYVEGLGTSLDYTTIKYDKFGNELWVKEYNGPVDSTDVALDIAVDEEGHAIVTGSSYGIGTWPDYTTIKYDSDGDTLWVRRYNGTGNYIDGPFAITVDNEGNIYVTGNSYGIGTSLDYVTVKYDTDGNELWTARYNGPSNGVDMAWAIDVDSDGNVYVTGLSDGIGTGHDYATIKYDNNGNGLWLERYDGPVHDDDVAWDVVVDDLGNVYVTGFSNGIGTAEDYATIKYNTDGNSLWLNRYDGLGNDTDEARAIALDEMGNVFITGWETGINGDVDYATIKYDSDGNGLWLSKHDGPSGQDDRPYDVAVDEEGHAYITGFSKSSTFADFNTIKYSGVDGSELWSMRYDGPANEGDGGLAITLDKNKNVFVTGISTGIGSDYDYTTIKYRQNPLIHKEPFYNGK